MPPHTHTLVRFRRASSCWLFSSREQVLLVSFFLLSNGKDESRSLDYYLGYFLVLLGIQPDSFPCITGQGRVAPFILSSSVAHLSACLAAPHPPLSCTSPSFSPTWAAWAFLLSSVLCVLSNPSSVLSQLGFEDGQDGPGQVESRARCLLRSRIWLVSSSWHLEVKKNFICQGRWARSTAVERSR